MRKTKIMISLSAVFVLWSGANQTRATIIDFYEDGTIVFGDIYQIANAYETAVVDVLGGSVGTFTAWDSSVINMNDGGISALVGRNSSELNVTNGSITILNTYDSSIVNVHGGIIEGRSHVFDGSVANIYGGTIPYVELHNVINVYGGTWGTVAIQNPSVAVNVFGLDLVVFPFGGLHGLGYVSGKWQDDTPFQIDLLGNYLQVNLVIIPEPVTISLLAFGCLVMRQRRRNRRTS